MRVKKRNGLFQEVSFDKVIHRLKCLCNMEPILHNIDVTEIVSLLKRKWHLIIFFIIGSALISIPYSLTRPKIWEGKFQIVLEVNIQ